MKLIMIYEHVKIYVGVISEKPTRLICTQKEWKEKKRILVFCVCVTFKTNDVLILSISMRITKRIKILC